MTQSAAETPIHNYQRKAAIANGGVRDHAGLVEVSPIPNFDLNRTIFNTLEGKLPRFVMRTRIAKEVRWSDAAGQDVEAAYVKSQGQKPLPEINEGLLQFMMNDCDFDVEHADGSFLDHLYFCFEYSHHHYPEHSPHVMLLHSILGTGTNTFAMSADKISGLQDLLNDFEWAHVEAFPSMLRLLYDMPLRAELWANRHRFSELEGIRFHRVIDNKPLEMTAEDFWIQLNFQLIHLIDFLPVANWSTHANDTSFILFRDLFDLLNQTGKIGAKLSYAPTRGSSPPQGEPQGLGSRLISLLPVKLSEKMAARSVRNFSHQINHSLSYDLIWRS